MGMGLTIRGYRVGVREGGTRHGLLIGINTLRDVVRLEIDDYSADHEMRAPVREYHFTLNEYAARMGQQFCFHCKDRSTL